MKLKLLLIFFLIVNLLSAHGIDCEVQQLNGIVILKSSYQDGEAVPLARVQIFYDDLQFQNGRTDLNGYFLFKPDRNGNWRAVIDDQLGHRREVEINFQSNKQFRNEKFMFNTQSQNLLLYIIKLILTLTAIFIVFGFFYLLKKKNRVTG